MPIYETYSKRKKAAARAGQADVYVYDQLPKFLRQQIVTIWRSSIGPYVPSASNADFPPPNSNPIWTAISEILARESEEFHDFAGKTPQGRCEGFLLQHAETDACLDLIELSCRAMATIAPEADPRNRGATITGSDGIAETNTRFREHGVGYQFENDNIVRVDNQYTHAEVIKPALALLGEKGFEKANEDFMTAHRHLRHGEEKDAITAANRAFESTLKAVCAARKWKYEPGARASDLIKVVRKHGLLPDYLDAGMDIFIAMMKTGLPKVRDNAGGHGSAPDAAEVAAHLAIYAINMAAANIRLVVEAHKTAAPGRAL